MAGEVELIKTNLYVGEGNPVAAVLLAKTNLLVGEAAAPAQALLAKTNLYLHNDTDPNAGVRLAKTNLYIGLSEDPYGQYVTTPLTDNSIDNEIFPIGVRSPADGTAIIESTDMERNPYRAHLSNDPVEVARDLQEQQRVLREQHNKTQAGDSTFDFGLLYKLYPNREFNLGSIGRFFSEDFGIVLARFVQFKGMVEHDWQGQPVGRVKANTGLVDWVVTNDLSESDPDLILGFTFTAELPQDGYYGWAVVKGANPAGIRVTSERTASQNEAYTWCETGAISLDESGTILGRRWAGSNKVGIPSGALFIGIEGRSDADLEAFVRDRLAEDLALLAAVKQGLDELNAWRVTINTSIADLEANDQSLLERIKKEELVRGREIQAIRGSTQIIDVDAKIQQATINLRNEFGAADQSVYARADQAFQISESVQAQLQGLDLSELDGVSGFAAAIAAVSTRLGGLSFDTVSLTEGQVFQAVEYTGLSGAPNYFVMEPIDYKFSKLPDVDWTTPPLAGESPVWNGAGKFVFLEFARADNSLVGTDEIEIVSGGELRDPITVLGHAESGVTPGTYGSSTKSAVITVNARGHVESVTLADIEGGGGEGGTGNPEPYGRHKYWRLLPTGSVNNSYVGVAELTFFDKPSGTNLIGGGTPIGAGTSSGSLANAFDGNPSTGWLGYPRGNNTWVGYQFAAEVSVAQVVIDTRNQNYNARLTSAKIQYSDNGVNWNDAFDANPMSVADVYITESPDFIDGELPVEYLTDAPVDGKIYGRKDSAWTEVTSGGGGIEEAPNNGAYYARRNEGWAAFTPGGGGGGSAAWGLVDTWTHSANVANVDFTNLGGYAELMVLARGWTHSTSAQRVIQVSANNGGTFDSTPANYPISPEDGNETLPGLGGWYPSTTTTGTGRGFALNIQNFNQTTMKWAVNPSRGAYRFYLPTVALNAIRALGVASNVPSGNITGGTIWVFGRM